jgi:uridine kinase
VPSDPEVPAEVLRRTLAAAPTLGGGRLLCIDGPAGSGKTTLANDVMAEVPTGTSARVVHLDDVYPGWTGLAEGLDRVRRLVVAPLAEGRPGGYHRYDWDAGREAEWVEVAPVDLLVLEGVGSGSAASPTQVTRLVWVEAPADLRLERGLARDGEAMRNHWLRWRVEEDALHAAHRTRERADQVVTTG